MAGPLYRQIAEDLRRQIDSGELPAGAQLPTEDELMENYHASRNTVRSAIKELTISGLVHTLHGKGTFATERVSPIVVSLTTDPQTGGGGGQGFIYTHEGPKALRIDTASELPRVEIQKASNTVSDFLGIPVGTYVISRHEQRFVDGRPWALQTSFYPRSLYQSAPRLLDVDPIQEGTSAYLAECGIRQTGYRDAIQVRSPNPSEVDLFDLPSDGRVQVFEVFRTAYDQIHNPIHLTVTVYRADKNRFVIDIGDAPASDRLQGLFRADHDGTVPR